MTTMNAKANTAYHELIAKTERENPGDVWAGFEHERDAFETGWEAGHEAARPVVDREAAAKALHESDAQRHVWASRFCSGACQRRYHQSADAVLALLSGR